MEAGKANRPDRSKKTGAGDWPAPVIRISSKN